MEWQKHIFHSSFRVKQLNDYVDHLEKKQNGEQANSKLLFCFSGTVYIKGATCRSCRFFCSVYSFVLRKSPKFRIGPNFCLASLPTFVDKFHKFLWSGCLKNDLG